MLCQRQPYDCQNQTHSFEETRHVGARQMRRSVVSSRSFGCCELHWGIIPMELIRNSQRGATQSRADVSQAENMANALQRAAPVEP